jgi:hypothetical protein
MVRVVSLKVTLATETVVSGSGRQPMIASAIIATAIIPNAFIVFFIKILLSLRENALYNGIF